MIAGKYGMAAAAPHARGELRSYRIYGIVLAAVWAAWALVYIFDRTRPEPLAQVAVQTPVWWVFVPYAAILALVAVLGGRWANMRLFDIRLYIALAPAALAAAMLLEPINARQPFVSGTVLSLGFMYLVAITAAYRLRQLGAARALITGAIFAFGVVYGWEVMYQLVLYWHSHGFPNLSGTLFVNALTALPAVAVALVYRIRPQAASWALLAGFLVVTAAWVMAGPCTLIKYTGAGWVAEPLEPVSYALSRASKLLLAGAVVMAR